MISLCMIIAPKDKEAELLDRCLEIVFPFVKDIQITITGENKKCEEVCKKYGANISHFEWVNDFAKARNFNFSQAKGEYILWLDADDILRGGEHLKKAVKLMKEQKVDCGVMNYLYAFNESGECTTKHLKTRIVKNDGCVEWAGRVHEDFKENRNIEAYFIKEIEVLHIRDDAHIKESANRNLDIAQDALKDAPDDPRSHYLMAQAYMGLGDDKAADWFKSFLKISHSDEEKYLVLLAVGDMLKEKKYYHEAIDLRPVYPNAYFSLGYEARKERRFEQALNFLEIGLQLPKPDMTMIVHNPRDYDYNPLMVMMDIYLETGEYQKAMKVFEELKKMFPEDKNLKDKGKLFDKVFDIAKKVEDATIKILRIKDKKYLKKFFDKLDPEIRQHPKMCAAYNANFIKETSSGKDLVFFCSYTSKVWNPEVAMEKGIGGSEEAIINLAKGLAKDWNVTVYNNCGNPKVYDGVQYRPFWEWNPKDKQDITVFWRHPKPLDWDINSDKIFIDMHDVIGDGEFTEERLKKINGVFFKSNAHRKIFPSVPDDKAIVIPNGVDPALFEQEVEKDPFLIINTSSPDRHLDATLDIFEELIRRQPEKPWKLAWYYGWDVYDGVHANNPEMMKWKEDMMTRFNILVAEGRAEGGYMINHKEIAKKYLEAGIFLYATNFFEIHCISAIKAQLAKCRMITSDFAALAESVKGDKVYTEGKRWPDGPTFGDIENKNQYVQRIIDQEFEDNSEWAKNNYSWNLIIDKWNNEISSPNK